MFSKPCAEIVIHSASKRFLTVAFCGGGNGAHVCSVTAGLASGNHTVNVLSTFAYEAERWDKASRSTGGTKIFDKPSRATKPNQPALITNDPEAALKDADVVLLSAPSFAHANYFELCKKFGKADATVGVLPGRAGIDLEFKSVIGPKSDTMSLINFATLPWACRIKTYGDTVEVLGTKDEVVCAVKGTKESLDTVQKLIGIKPTLVAGSSNLGLSMNSPGGVVHPGIMFAQWSRWGGQPLDAMPLFYQGADAYTDRVLTNLSDEILSIRDAICFAYPQVDLTDVIHIRDWYKQSYPDADHSTLEKALTTTAAYDGLTHPCIKNEEGKFLPNYQARYLTEDVGYTLLFNKGLGLMTGINTPQIDDVVYWAQEQMGKSYMVDGKLTGSDLAETRAPQKYGFSDLETFLAENNYAEALLL